MKISEQIQKVKYFRDNPHVNGWGLALESIWNLMSTVETQQRQIKQLQEELESIVEGTSDGIPLGGTYVNWIEEE